MAPSKRLLKELKDGEPVEPTSAVGSTRRVTRSSTSGVDSAARGSTAAAPPRKRAKKTTTPAVKKEEQVKNEKEKEKESEVGSNFRTITVEHCKQCNSFKTRAVQVKQGLEKAVSGVAVLLNPEKPRRGCFEIREEGGETFISLLDMKRPFKPMKDLDMEEVISDIIKKIQHQA